jgi:glycosyltransferase involved in cell wall biosynthesis
LQFHILSFEGPDAYARAGGLASRVEGLGETLANLGFETHLWFIGDPDLPGCEVRGNLHLHRWCQWVSRHHPGGVYDGEEGKLADYRSSLPPFLVREVLAGYLAGGGRAVVLAEEWHTAEAVTFLHRLLQEAGLRDRVSLLWNANNTFGFDRIDWASLSQAATVTTVSRFMKQQLWRFGIDPLVIPNGLPSDAFDQPERGAVLELRQRFRDRTVLTKMARFDPDKRWLATVDIVGELKLQRWRPLLVARGGLEPHGADVLRAARMRGLIVVDREVTRPGVEGLLGALADVGQADVVNLRSYVDPPSRRALFRSADAVMANSDREPFGLVGLETMAVGGLACTGCSGEDYAVQGQNAIVLQTSDPREFLGLFRRLRANPDQARALRRHARSTARRYAWPEIIDRVLLPRAELSHFGV